EREERREDQEGRKRMNLRRPNHLPQREREKEGQARGDRKPRKELPERPYSTQVIELLVVERHGARQGQRQRELQCDREVRGAADVGVVGEVERGAGRGTDHAALEQGE